MPLIQNYKSVPFLLLVLTSFFFIKAIAQPAAIIAGDFPDPTVIHANGKYYAVGTSSEWAPHFPIYSSSDLQNWEQNGFVFSNTPEWAESSFWAPEYFFHKGLYYLYYSAKRKGDGVSCIGVATSRFPDRDFVDHGIVVAFGSESIDAYVVKEGEDLYMTWKAYGLDDRPIELLGSKMSSDGMKLVGEPFTLLKDNEKIGIEGQSFVKKDGYYYMFYSAGACCGPGCNYRVYASRSRSIRGPFINVGETVLLGENEDWKCMGHGTFVKGPSDKLYYLFHGYNKIGFTYTGREGLLAELIWSDKGDPVFDFIPNTTIKEDVLKIDFTKTKDLLWQWDFRNTKPIWKFAKNGVGIRGEIKEGNEVGVVLGWRARTKTYSIETNVVLQENDNSALAGLSIYGDKEKAIGIGIEKNSVQVWHTKGQKFHVLKSIKLPTEITTIELKLEVLADLSCKAFYKTGKNNWIEVSLQERDIFTIKDLAPWDRSPRPSLHVKGREDQFGYFSAVKLKYN